MAKPVLPRLKKKIRTTALEVLECSLDILSNPKRWLKGQSSTTVRIERGDGKREYDVGAFCLSGAMWWCAEGSTEGNLFYNARKQLEEAIAQKIGHHSGIEYFNDRRETNHEDVVAVLAAAVEREKKKQEAKGGPVTV